MKWKTHHVVKNLMYRLLLSMRTLNFLEFFHVLRKLKRCTVFSIWWVRPHLHTPAHAPLVWCVQKIARATYVYDTHCLEYWNEENVRKNKNVKFNGWSFSLTFVKLSLAWMLYFHVWLQNKGKFLVWTEYYNQFGIIRHCEKDRNLT